MSTALPSYKDSDPDTLLVCPYDPVHRVAAKRFPYHLNKCRKNHSAGGYIKCPFNARHEMPAVEMQYHLTICPDKDVIRQDIESAVAPVRRIVSSNRPPTPPPTQGLDEDTEDWDTEADNAPFVPAMASQIHETATLDSYAVIQDLQEVQQQLHGSGPPVPVNPADMTAAQRKNYKRAQKRREKREAEEGEEEDVTEEERREALLQQYSLMSGKAEGGFVDFISLLNQWCQKNRVNPPRYMEGPGVAGGFGAVCVVRTDQFRSNKHCQTKKDAKQNAAMVAVVGLNIPIGGDDCRVTGLNPKSANERERMRQTQEQRLLLQAGYNTPQPVLQPPSSFAPPRQPVATAPPAYKEPAAAGMEQQTASVSLSDQEADDGWSTVPSRKPAGVKNPVYNYSLKVAGRGRGARR